MREENKKNTYLYRLSQIQSRISGDEYQIKLNSANGSTNWLNIDSEELTALARLLTSEIEPIRAHLIEVKYVGPSETKGSRVKLSSARFGDSVTISYDHGFNSPSEMAIAWLDERIGSSAILFEGETKNGDIIGVSVFEPLKAIKNY